MRKSARGYTYEEYYIPDYMAKGVDRYVNDGVPPGHFLTAVICNDLRGALERADSTNIRNLPAYVAFFYNEAPIPCWGSPEKFDNWIAQKAKEREEAQK